MNNSFNLINKTHKEFFKQNGYIILRNQLTYKNKKNLLKSVFDIEFDALNKKNKHIHNYELDSNNNKVLSRSEYFYHNHKNIKSFINDETFKYVLNTINEKPVNIYKEKINYKYPNTGSYKAHQDITAYPNSNNHLTCLIPLCNTYKLNGSIQFSPLINNNLSQNTILDNKNGIIDNQDKLSWDPPISTSFGDIILFNSYIPHKSPINLSTKPRKSLYLTFNNLEEGFLRDNYYKIKNNILENDSKKISIIDHYEHTKINISNYNIDKKYIIDNIINIYKTKGHTYYDKNITQNQHAFSTMNLAIQKSEPKYFQLLCFLHDLGHLILDESDNNTDFLKQNLHHELIAYNFLTQYFPDKITKPILLHVMAKRYLCSLYKPYYNKLSSSSKKSLELQGGLLTQYQIKKFEKNKYFNDAYRLRQIEDESKQKKHDNIIINFNYVEQLLNEFYI